MEKVRKKITVIMNPVAGRRLSQQIEDTLEQLRAVADVMVHETARSGHAEEIARALDPEVTDAVVAVGGDGTANEIANGIMGTQIPLGLLPFGTANVLAREIGVFGDPLLAVATIVNGVAKPVHLGKAGARYFLLMVGVGFDADVVYRLNQRLKSALSKFAYVCSGTNVWCRPQPAQIRLTIDGMSVTACSAIIGNAHFYGGSFQVTPNARLQEPSLEICLFKKNGRLDILRYAWGIFSRRHARYNDVELFKGRRIRIESSQHVHAQIDGDYLGVLPLDITVAEHTINLLMPSSNPNPA